MISSVPGNYCDKNYDWSKSKTAGRYNAMRDAIIKTERPMLYSLCEWGEANVQTWGNQTAQSWRSTGDIQGNLPDGDLSRGVY
jgi:alpha-galactosidase